jgi:hypothetical protein
MSFSLFKANMYSYMSNQSGVGSYEDWSAKITNEYDQAIKRGKQTTNQGPIATGKNSAMESACVRACESYFAKQDGLHTFVDEIGKASIKYWTGAKLVTIVPPIPAIGAIVNIASTAAYVTNPGTWSPTGPDAPTLNIMQFLNKLVGGFTVHLTTVQGNYDTISNYPGFPVVPPAPGVRPWKGWLVPG